MCIEVPVLAHFTSISKCPHDVDDSVGQHAGERSAASDKSQVRRGFKLASVCCAVGLIALIMDEPPGHFDFTVVSAMGAEALGSGASSSQSD